MIELDLPEAERTCPSCGKAMRAIGEDVTERGHIVPVRIVVRRYVRRKYACPDGHAVRTAPAPEGVIDGAKYEASVYAHVVTAKYCDHLPLHRLEGMGLIQGRWQTLPNGRQRRYYHITEKGLHGLETKRDQWLDFLAAVNLIINPTVKPAPEPE